MPGNRMYCTTCGAISEPKSHVPGSFWTELALWCLLILPGMFYTAWRLASRRLVCAVCGAPTLIPTTSPRAAAAVAAAQRATDAAWSRATTAPADLEVKIQRVLPR